jgi:hypothetical protein
MIPFKINGSFVLATISFISSAVFGPTGFP